MGDRYLKQYLDKLEVRNSFWSVIEHWNIFNAA